MAKDPGKRWQDARALKTRFGATEEGGLPDALESTRGHGVSFVMIAAVLLALGYMVVYRLQNAPID